MTKGLFALSLAALLAATAPIAVAQTTDSAESTENSETNGDIEELLNFGDEGEPQIGQPYTAEEIGDWEMRCIKTETGDDPCQMYQLLIDEENQPVAEFTLFRLPEGGRAVAGATLIVPLETLLPEQVRISVDGANARGYPYAFCNPVGCYARIGLTAEDIASYKAGNVAQVIIVPALAPDQTVALNMSLTGFTASFDKVTIVDR